MSEDTKKRRRAGFFRRYASGFLAFVQTTKPANIGSAVSIGRLGMSLGIKTLELARIHEQAVALRAGAVKSPGRTKRSDLFFAEALTPYIETHKLSRNAKGELRKLNRTLKHRTSELATAHQHLKKGIERRKRVEADLIRSGEHYSKLLKKSLRLQDGLRTLTHKVLAAQEKERLKTSRELQNELGQTLLGINVRLLSLQREARTNSAGLRLGLVDTQQLIARTARRATRVAKSHRSK